MRHNENMEAAKVTQLAAELQFAVVSGEASEIIDRANRLLYALGDVVERATGRKYAGLDLCNALELIIKNADFDGVEFGHEVRP